MFDLMNEENYEIIPDHFSLKDMNRGILIDFLNKIRNNDMLMIKASYNTDEGGCESCRPF